MYRVLLAVFIFWTSNGMAASFNCSKAASLAEMTICNDDELSRLEEELFAIYKQAKEAAPDKKQFSEQSRGSWKWREEHCFTKECLLAWYVQRKKVLEDYLVTEYLVGASNSTQMTLKEASRGGELVIEPSDELIYPSKIKTYYNQTRLDLVATFSDGSSVKLPYTFKVGYETDGEMSWEMKGNKYILAQQDLTSDGIDEIIFAVLVDDNGMYQAEVNVFQYFPPLRQSDVARAENWKLSGDLQAIGVVGEPKIELAKNSVTIPRNLRGFYYEITWLKDRFHDTGDY